ncbi:MAG: LEA type 2 family protein [Treponema sp.]|jgi:hypothetical protein|nr:LEA type 2 family protein [Treponema sp.]
MKRFSLPRFFMVLLLMEGLFSCTGQAPHAPLPELPPIPRGTVPGPSAGLAGEPFEPAEEEPGAALYFDHIEAADLEHISLYFRLEVENPQTQAALVELRGWSLLIDGIEAPGSLSLEHERAPLGPGLRAAYPLRLDLDLAGLGPALLAADLSLRVELYAEIAFSYPSSGEILKTLPAEAAFSPVLRPEFSILSILIEQTGLINTHLKLKLRVDNPNFFPLELAGLSYELYGMGRFWAEGIESQVLMIPPRGSAETELSLVMNFINMNRELLDQITGLREVPYGLSGEALLCTGLDYLPQFRMSFEHSGTAVVRE